MKDIEEKQIKRASDVLIGQERDKDGYCSCPNCGSRKLTHDGHSLDDGYIKCDLCEYYISGGPTPFELLVRWNAFYRKSFQLKIPFVEKEYENLILKA